MRADATRAASRPARRGPPGQRRGPACQLSRRPLLTLAALVALSPLITGCTGETGGSGGDRRSTENFCAELAAGNERLKTNVTSAPQTGEGQLVAALSNVGEFTRLLHRLDEVAPAEIRSDMHDARGLWDSQADQTAKAASDPLGAILGGLMSGLMNAAATQAVDVFAEENCGTTIFAPSSSTTAGAGDGCPDSGFGGALRPLDSDSSYADLRTALVDMTSSSDTAMAAAATTVLAATDTLDPAPSYSVEALGRLAFHNLPATEVVLTALNDAVGAVCPSALISPDWISSGLGELTPGHVEDQVVFGDAYGRCADRPVGWADGKQMLWCPSEGQLAIVDPDEGTVSYETPDGLEGSEDPSYYAEPGDLVYPEPFPAIGGVAWIAETYTEADGLEAQEWTTTLHAVDVDGAELFTPIVLGSSPQESGGAPEVVGTPEAVLATNQKGTTAYGPDGAVLWRSEEPRWGGYQPTPQTFSDETTTRVVATGDQVATDPVDGDDTEDVCGVSALAAANIVVDPVDDVPLTVPINRAVVGTLNFAASADTTVVEEGSDGAATGYSADGDKLWHLSADVVADYYLLGRFVIVTNEAGQHVVVDATTGEDVTTEQPDVADLVAEASDAPQLLTTGPDGDLLFGVPIEADGMSELHTVPASVCAVS